MLNIYSSVKPTFLSSAAAPAARTEADNKVVAAARMSDSAVEFVGCKPARNKGNTRLPVL
jgi:hypothetical protein